MSELSKDARDLAATLTDNEYRYGDVVFDRDQWLRVARAALELAGVEISHEDIGQLGEAPFKRRYACGATSILLKMGYGSQWRIEIHEMAIGFEAAPLLSLILLHAARTAREWASEGGKNEPVR